MPLPVIVLLLVLIIISDCYDSTIPFVVWSGHSLSAALDVGVGGQEMLGALILSFLTLWAAPQAPASQSAKTANVAVDPYAPLRLYDGKWDVLPASADTTAETVHLENHCAKVGEFFACNQVVSGKNIALVIFLPLHPLENGGYAYHNQALRVEGDDAGTWGALEITRDRWVYSSDATDKGKKTYSRVTNVFSGPDKIHFEVQQSDDGVNWTTKMRGDEVRAK